MPFSSPRYVDLVKLPSAYAAEYVNPEPGTPRYAAYFPHTHWSYDEARYWIETNPRLILL